MPGDVQVRVQFRKLVTCGHCGCVYRVDEPRNASGRGDTTDEAVARAERKVRAAWWVVPRVPCPCCLRVPPAIGLRLFFLLVMFFVLPIAWLAAVFVIDQEENLRVLVIGVPLSVCALAACVLWRHPNRDPQRNAERVQSALACEDVSVVRPGTVDPESLPRIGAWRAVLVLFGGVAAALVFLIAPAYRAVNDLPNNPGMPSLYEPGDELRVDFNDTIRSVDYRWAGKAVAWLEVPGEPGTRVPLDASSQNSSWSPAYINSRQPVTTSKLWATVRFPNDPGLGGKRVRVHVTLDATYPVALEGKKFDNRTTRAERTVELQLAPPGAATKGRRVVRLSALGGGALTLAVYGLAMLFVAFERKPKYAVAFEPTAVTYDLD